MDIQLYLGRYTDSFTYLGFGVAAYIACKFTLSLWSAIRSYCLARVFDIGPDLKSMGTWAVVTGSTDGIGKAYAHELASKGINIVLISRTPEKLERVAKEIEAEYPVQTKCIAVDYATLGMEIYEKIKKELEGMEVGILVNNVGIIQELPEAVHMATDPKKLMDVVTINSQSVVQMTWIVLPQMIARKKGAIINISSASGLMPVPLLAVYSASKAFVDHFTDAVQFETRGTGVIIQLVNPLFLATNMSKMSSNILVPTAPTFVRAAIATVGLEKTTFGYITHGLQGHALKIPRSWFQYGAEILLRNIGANMELQRQREAKIN